MLHKIKKETLLNPDMIGIIASLICLIHCLVFPVLISLGLVIGFENHGHFHYWDYLFVILSIYAVYKTNKHQQHLLVKLSFWLVVSAFSVSILFHSWHFSMIFVSMGSSILLVFLHGFIWFYSIKCNVLKK